MSQASSGILTGARAAVAALEDVGVQVAFGLPGVHNLPIWREMNASPIRLVGVRHEQTAAYAADGYARASGRLNSPGNPHRRSLSESAGRVVSPGGAASYRLLRVRDLRCGLPRT